MAIFGGGVRPELGRTDYSAIARGGEVAAQMAGRGAEAMGRGLAQAGSALGEAIKEYEQNKVLTNTQIGNIEGAVQSGLVNPEEFTGKSAKLFGKLQKNGTLSLPEAALLNAFVNQSAVTKQNALKQALLTEQTRVAGLQAAALERLEENRSRLGNAIASNIEAGTGNVDVENVASSYFNLEGDDPTLLEQWQKTLPQEQFQPTVGRIDLGNGFSASYVTTSRGQIRVIDYTITDKDGNPVVQYKGDPKLTISEQLAESARQLRDALDNGLITQKQYAAALEESQRRITGIPREDKNNILGKILDEDTDLSFANENAARAFLEKNPLPPGDYKITVAGKTKNVRIGDESQATTTRSAQSNVPPDNDVNVYLPTIGNESVMPRPTDGVYDFSRFFTTPTEDVIDSQLESGANIPDSSDLKNSSVSKKLVNRPTSRRMSDVQKQRMQKRIDELRERASVRFSARLTNKNTEALRRGYLEEANRLENILNQNAGQ